MESLNKPRANQATNEIDYFSWQKHQATLVLILLRTYRNVSLDMSVSWKFGCVLKKKAFTILRSAYVFKRLFHGLRTKVTWHLRHSKQSCSAGTKNTVKVIRTC
jgi:hypothetical protein